MRDMIDSRVPKELYRRVFELTLALYRVTDFFPKGESLQKQMREKANQILSGVTEYGFSPDHTREEAALILAKIQSIQTYVHVVSSLGFVRPINLVVLEREYQALSDFFRQDLESLAHAPVARETPKKDETARQDVREFVSDNTARNIEQNRIPESAPKRPVPKSVESVSTALNNRQETIVDYVKKSQRAKISDLQSFFPTISTKTVQRDLQDLVVKNILKKEGEKRWTVYMMRGVL